MQTKLTLSFIGFALIPLFIVLQWTLTYIHKDQTFNQAQDTSRLIKTELSQHVRERLRDIESFSLNEIFWEHAQQNEEVFKKDLETYSNALVATHPEYKIILMVDPKGVVQVVNTKDAAGEHIDTSALKGKSFERSTWFQKAINIKEAFIETPRDLAFVKTIYDAKDLNVVPIAKSIRKLDGSVTSVWVIFSDATFLNKILESSAESVNTPGQFGIFDRAGNKIAEHNTFAGKEYERFETATELISFEGHDWSIKSQLKEDTLLEYLKIYFWPVTAVIGLIIIYALVAARRLTIPLQRLIHSAEFIVKGQFSFGVPYQERRDEYGRLSRALMEMQRLRGSSKSKVNIGLNASECKAQETSQKIEDALQLVNGLSAQTNMLALNASMEAVKAHHLDEVAEKANELAQRTSYNSQELLKKLNEIKAVCDEIQNNQSSDNIKSIK